VQLRLDYLSCVLTVVSTILVGKRYWEGWILATVNSVIVCVIALKTSQLGFIPANVFCIGLYAMNVRNWRRQQPSHDQAQAYCGVPPD
jgi:nicotinamide riboside transporter PnuC